MQRAFPREGEKITTRVPGDNPDYQDHLHTYRGFVRGIFLFAAHVCVVLLLFFWFLA